MALTRKFLSALGIEADKIDEIITAHSETVDGLKAQRDEYKAKADKYDDVQKQLDEVNGKEDFESKYKALKKEFDDYKADIKSKQTKAQIENAYKQILLESGIAEKRVDKILKVTDLSNIKLTDGKIENADEVKKNIKEEWSDFIVSKSEKGADVNTPPSNSGTKMSKEDILKIKDAGERQKAMIENHELFGF